MYGRIGGRDDQSCNGGREQGDDADGKSEWAGIN